MKQRTLTSWSQHLRPLASDSLGVLGGTWHYGEASVQRSLHLQILLCKFLLCTWPCEHVISTCVCQALGTFGEHLLRTRSFTGFRMHPFYRHHFLYTGTCAQCSLSTCCGQAVVVHALRQRQAHLCSNLFHIVSYRPARITQRHPVSETKPIKKPGTIKKKDRGGGKKKKERRGRRRKKEKSA